MAQLNPADRVALVTFLQRLPVFQQYRGRRQLLELAGLDSVIPQLDLEGPTFVIAGEIVSVLSHYGRVAPDREALGLLLNATKEIVGSADADRALIDRLLRDYQLMTPARASPDIARWEPATNAEKIIGENTLRHVAFLRRGLEVSGAVALVDVREWTGTAFCVAPSLMVTNHHVIPERGVLAKTRVRFNYQLTFEGAEDHAVEHLANPEGSFWTDQQLDLTIFEVLGTPGHDWGIPRLNPIPPVIGDRVNIVQHPGGLPKQVSFQNNFVEYADGHVIQYVTSTLNGSSGAPVFDDHWSVVAVHHAGGQLTEPSSGATFFRNEGVAVGRMLARIPSGLRSQLGHPPASE